MKQAVWVLIKIPAESYTPPDAATLYVTVTRPGDKMKWGMSPFYEYNRRVFHLNDNK